MISGNDTNYYSSGAGSAVPGPGVGSDESNVHFTNDSAKDDPRWRIAA